MSVFIQDKYTEAGEVSRGHRAQGLTCLSREFGLQTMAPKAGINLLLLLSVLSVSPLDQMSPQPASLSAASPSAARSELYTEGPPS